MTGEGIRDIFLLALRYQQHLPEAIVCTTAADLTTDLTNSVIYKGGKESMSRGF